MSGNALFFMEFVIFSGVALVWAIREYMSVRPEKEAPPSSPDDPRHPEG